MTLIELATLRISEAFYNPSADGGIERTARVSNIDAPTARYPFAVSLSGYARVTLIYVVLQVTLHQGAIEQIFFDSLAAMDVYVDRPIVPTSIQLSEDKDELADPTSHPVRVRRLRPPYSVQHRT